MVSPLRTLNSVLVLRESNAGPDGVLTEASILAEFGIDRGADVAVAIHHRHDVKLHTVRFELYGGATDCGYRVRNFPAR